MNNNTAFGHDNLKLSVRLYVAAILNFYRAAPFQHNYNIQPAFFLSLPVVMKHSKHSMVYFNDNIMKKSQKILLNNKIIIITMCCQYGCHSFISKLHISLQNICKQPPFISNATLWMNIMQVYTQAQQRLIQMNLRSNFEHHPILGPFIGLFRDCYCFKYHNNRK